MKIRTVTVIWTQAAANLPAGCLVLSEHGRCLKEKHYNLPVTPNNLFRMPEPENEVGSDSDETISTAGDDTDVVPENIDVL